jgi:hypothetical protein
VNDAQFYGYRQSRFIKYGVPSKDSPQSLFAYNFSDDAGDGCDTTPSHPERLRAALSSMKGNAEVEIANNPNLNLIRDRILCKYKETEKFIEHLCSNSEGK